MESLILYRRSATSARVIEGTGSCRRCTRPRSPAVGYTWIEFEEYIYYQVYFVKILLPLSRSVALKAGGLLISGSFCGQKVPREVGSQADVLNALRAGELSILAGVELGIVTPAAAHRTQNSQTAQLQYGIQRPCPQAKRRNAVLRQFDEAVSLS